VDTNRRIHELSRQAYTDALTGLPNRRALDERLEEEIRRSSRYRHSFTLIMIDLNSFKAINDSLGHPAGDQALQRMADCLRRTLRDTDFVARYGGDEFAVILPETTLEAAEAIALRLSEDADRCSLELTDLPDGTATISFGLASYPEQAISPGGLITAADQALYNQKQSYRLTNR
jgi:diguanylate cyclase (GGDEF)-like protein